MQSKKSQALTAIESRITLPGCEIHKNGLLISDEVTPDQLGQIKGTLRTINESGLWWWGDFLNFCEFKRGISYEAVAEETGYQEQSLRIAKMVCGKFPLLRRINNLSFNHHLDALKECQGDANKAHPWLKKAGENGWSISETRKQIRTGTAEHSNEDDPGQPNVMKWVHRIKTWFRQEPTPSQARVLLPDLEAATEQCRKIAEAA